MYELSVFEKVRRADYTVNPYEANKLYSIDSDELDSLGYTFKKGYYYKDSLAISSSKAIAVNAPTSSDGTYNYLNWRLINHLYYRNGYNPYESLEGYRKNYTDKALFLTASIISAPYLDMGDGFRKGTIIVTGSNLSLKDDSNNNLYDASIASSSIMDSSYLDAYFGFQDLYKFTTLGYSNNIDKSLEFFSNTISDPTTYRLKNIGVSEGVEVDGVKSGAQANFLGSSYIEIPHHEELSYELEEDFTISLWVKAPPSQSNTTHNTNSIITKKTYTYTQNFGEYQTKTDSGYSYKRNIISSSLAYSPVAYYPYQLSIYNQTAGASKGKIIFERSDGLKKLTLTSVSALNDGNYHHICVVKNNNLLSLYVDGVAEASGSDLNEQPTNAHSIIFGADDKNSTRQFSGSLDEIRFYSKAATLNQVSQSLSNSNNILLYQTTNIGNVYYKRGEIIITSPIKKYHTELDINPWTLQYKNIYTIYEYETLVRVKAGSFNKTMNPTSTQSPKSNLYLNDFTGSLAPYATTVGLYNKDFKLVAVAKLARPLKMRDDVDINILVRFDY
jgi:hypothetical protein